MGPTIDPALDAAIRGGLALLLASAVFHKLRDLTGFRSTIRAYELVPDASIAAVATSLVAFEAGLVAALLFAADSGRSLGAVAAAALFTAYGGAIAVNLYRGRRDLDCGCGLGAGLAQEKIGPGLLVRNLTLALAALTVSGPLSARPFLALDAVTAFAAVLGTALLYLSAERVRALPLSLSGEPR